MNKLKGNFAEIACGFLWVSDSYVCGYNYEAIQKVSANPAGATHRNTNSKCWLIRLLITSEDIGNTLYLQPYKVNKNPNHPILYFEFIVWIYSSTEKTFLWTWFAPDGVPRQMWRGRPRRNVPDLILFGVFLALSRLNRYGN